jgi:hypothetical protein
LADHISSFCLMALGRGQPPREHKPRSSSRRMAPSGRS